MYLDYAETQAQKGVVMYMKDWIEKLDAFLQFNEYQVLKDPGNVSHEIAKRIAEHEYDKYRVIQDQSYESDFDKELKKLSVKMKSTKPGKEKEGLYPHKISSPSSTASSPATEPMQNLSFPFSRRSSRNFIIFLKPL